MNKTEQAGFPYASGGGCGDNANGRPPGGGGSSSGSWAMRMPGTNHGTPPLYGTVFVTGDGHGGFTYACVGGGGGGYGRDWTLNPATPDELADQEQRRRQGLAEIRIQLRKERPQYSPARSGTRWK